MSVIKFLPEDKNNNLVFTKFYLCKCDIAYDICEYKSIVKISHLIVKITIELFYNFLFKIMFYPQVNHYKFNIVYIICRYKSIVETNQLIVKITI